MQKYEVGRRRKKRLRGQAYVVGSVASSIGWVVFALGLLFSTFGLPYLPLLFKLTGVLIVVGWLLTRFASGLFPFSRRVFKG